MQNTNNWISELADRLTRDMTARMSKITLRRIEHPPRPRPRMDRVYSFVNGQFDMELHFDAEPSLFVRMARNMIGDEPEDQLEMQEYATEFFNVLCGRFLAEIGHATHQMARFSPTVYILAERIYEQPKPGFGPGLESKLSESEYNLYFLSDEQELARFSWSQKSLKEILDAEPAPSGSGSVL